jgi:hypothetical protein
MTDTKHTPGVVTEGPQLGDTVVNHEGKSPQVVGSHYMPLEVAQMLVAEGHARIIQREHRHGGRPLDDAGEPADG